MTGKFANYFQLLDSFRGTTKGLQRWYPFCLRGKKDHTKALCISTGAEFLGTQDKLTTHSVEVHITCFSFQIRKAETQESGWSDKNSLYAYNEIDREIYR